MTNRSLADAVVGAIMVATAVLVLSDRWAVNDGTALGLFGLAYLIWRR